MTMPRREGERPRRDACEGEARDGEGARARERRGGRGTRVGDRAVAGGDQRGSWMAAGMRARTRRTKARAARRGRVGAHRHRRRGDTWSPPSERAQAARTWLGPGEAHYRGPGGGRARLKRGSHGRCRSNYSAPVARVQQAMAAETIAKGSTEGGRPPREQVWSLSGGRDCANTGRCEPRKAVQRVRRGTQPNSPSSPSPSPLPHSFTRRV